jgi:hypothetical protein
MWGRATARCSACPMASSCSSDVYRCPDHGIDIFKLLDDVLPDNGDGRKRLKYLVVTHAHDDHITGIGDLYDGYAIEWLWLPQHEDREQIAKHFGEYQRVADEHPDDKIYRPQGSRTPLDVDLGEGVSVLEQAVIDATVRATLAGHARSRPGEETGGILIGHRVGATTVWITRASPPGPRALHRRCRFSRDTAHLQRYLDDIVDRTNGREDYIGECPSRTRHTTEPR